MSDIYSILSSNYLTVGSSVSPSNSKYVNVDPTSYEGSWSGKYGNGQSFTVTISNVNGFRATAKYQSGSTIQYQDVLIKDSAFRIGDSKFSLTSQAGVAQVSTVTTDAASGTSSVETATASRQ